MTTGSPPAGAATGGAGPVLDLIAGRSGPGALTPFWIPLALRARLPLAALWALLALAAFFGQLGLMAATGELGVELFETARGRSGLLVSPIVGLVFVALPFVVRGSEQDLAELRPVLPCTPAAFDSLLAALRRGRPRGIALAALLGFLGGQLVQQLVFGRLSLFLRGGSSGLDVGAWLAITVFWVVGGVNLAVIFANARLFSRLGADHVEVDLLDLRPLQPLARHGLRLALMWTVTLACFVPLWLNVRVEGVQTVGAVALVATAAWLSLAPMWGVHRRIQALKTAELDRVQGAIRGDREALVGSRIASDRHTVSLVDLIAYKQLVASAREWPFDTPAVARFALYLLIPVAGWVGGALVERLLEGALG